jgi:hypothetical protein
MVEAAKVAPLKWVIEASSLVKLGNLVVLLRSHLEVIHTDVL